MEEDRNFEERRPSSKEEKAIVLDFLPNGYPFDSRPMYRKNAIVQALGLEHFTLLEMVPKKGIFLRPNEAVYIGDNLADLRTAKNANIKFIGVCPPNVDKVYLKALFKSEGAQIVLNSVNDIVKVV